MVVGLTAKWRTMPGIRLTSSTPFSVDVEAYADLNPAGGGGIDRVEFSVSVNGGAATVTTVTAPSMRTPTFSNYNSPLPGITSGMAPFWGYGITIIPTAHAGGTIVVTAVAYSVSGASVNVTSPFSAITLYNDSDSVDRRPSPVTKYVSTTGSDSNDGSIGSPYATIQKAVESAGTGPTNDCGGAEIIVLPGAHLWCGGRYGVPSWHTSGDWWVTITFSEGATVSRSMMAYPDDWATDFPLASLMATGASGNTGRCNVRINNANVLGYGPVVAASVPVRLWADGGTSGSARYDNATNEFSVRFVDTTGDFLGFDGPQIAVSKRFVSCHTRRGVSYGFAGFTWAQDCVVRDFLGLGFHATGDETGNTACNMLMDKQRYVSADDINGRLVTTTNTAITGRAIVSITFGAGVSTYLMNIADVNFRIKHFEELVGSGYWGINITGTGNPANSGTFRVQSAALVNGDTQFQFVVVNASGVTEGACTIGMSLVKFSNDDTYNNLVHPDILMFSGNRTDMIFSNIAGRDVTGAQGIFTTGGNHTNLWCVNVNASGMVSEWSDSSLTDCGFVNCDMGAINMTGVPEVHSGVNIVDCRINNYGYLPADGVSGNYIRGNSFNTSGSANGTDPTIALSAAWYAADPTVDPFHRTPATEYLGTAVDLIGSPAEYYFDTATASSIGCWRNTAEFDWQPTVIEPPPEGGNDGDNGGQQTTDSGALPGDQLPTTPLVTVRSLTATMATAVEFETRGSEKLSMQSIYTKGSEGNITYALQAYVGGLGLWVDIPTLPTNTRVTQSASGNLAFQVIVGRDVTRVRVQAKANTPTTDTSIAIHGLLSAKTNPFSTYPS